MGIKLSDEAKIRRQKLRILNKKQETVKYERNDEDRKVKCPVCSKEITEEDVDDVEYVKTKRGTEILIHTKCVSNWGR